MSIAQNFPEISPSLLIDFANVKTLDPRIAFSRASTGTFYDANGLLRTADANEARFQFDPVTGVSEGLLRENQATNLVLRSEEFDDASWVKSSGVSVTANTNIAPDGTLTADTLTSSANQITQGQACSISTFYTDSLYFKKTSGATYQPGMYLLFTGGTTVIYAARLDTDTGVATAVSASGFTAPASFSVSDAGGYWRLSVTGNSNNNTAASLRLYANLNAVGGNGAGVQIIWGAQLEASSYPTSYIKTVASQVTRAADTAVLTNVDAYNTAEFTAVSKPFGVSGVSATQTVLNGDVPIERLYVYPRNLPQDQINTLVENDGWWSWRIVGSSFALPNFTTDGTVEVDWGDGTVETLTTAVHTFTNASPHTVRFRLTSGTTFTPSINGNATYKNMVVAVGSAPSNMLVFVYRGFYNCTNLKSIDATLVSTTDSREAWANCTSLTSFPFIDTSSCVGFLGTFNGCTKLTSFPLIDTSSGTNFNQCWYNNISLTSFPLIDTSSATTMSQTWYGCTSLTSFPLINTSSVITFGAWQNCTGLTSFPAIDTSSGTTFASTWFNCTSLTSFPQIDTSSGTNFSDTWNNCNKLTSFPLLDMSSATNLNECWDTCNSLTSFPAIDFPVCTNFTETWRSCSSLTSFPLVDTSAGTTFVSTWRSCTSLTSFPLIDTSSATSFASTWESCTGLTSFPLINTTSATNVTSAWFGCSSLTSFPLIDTSSCTNFASTWRSCSSLTSFPLIDTSAGTTFVSTWLSNSNLQSFPLLNMSSATNLTGTWQACSSLQEFPMIDTSSATQFIETWRQCTSLTSFPLLNINSGTTFYQAWRLCTALTDFPANFFDSWTGTPAVSCFTLAWSGCSSLTPTSVVNILTSIDASGKSAPTGTQLQKNIWIDYAGGDISAANTAIANLKSKGWEPYINGVYV